jgi:hypothetical protein
LQQLLGGSVVFLQRSGAEAMTGKSLIAPSWCERVGKSLMRSLLMKAQRRHAEVSALVAVK